MSLLQAEYGQDGHLYGFSPVCVRWWVDRWSLRENTCTKCNKTDWSECGGSHWYIWSYFCHILSHFFQFWSYLPIVWSYLVLLGHIWQNVVIFGPTWSYLVLFGHIWSYSLVVGKRLNYTPDCTLDRCRVWVLGIMVITRDFRNQSVKEKADKEIEICTFKLISNKKLNNW